MSGLLTDYANAAVMDLVLGGVPWEPVAWLTVGLSLGPANAAGRVVEPTASSYFRAEVVNGTREFPRAMPAGVLKSNAVEIAFPRPLDDWGLVRSVFLAEPGGDVLVMIDLKRPMFVRAGDDPPRLRAGALDWR